MLNVRIRQRFLQGGLTVGTVGAPVNLTYDTINLGLTPASLQDLAHGNHTFCEVSIVVFIYEILLTVEQPWLANACRAAHHALEP